MVLLRRLILMIQFLTTIPIPAKLDVKEEDFGKGLIFAPLVGLLIGGILALLYRFADFIFPTNVVIVFIMVLYIILTGGLHLDGLGDTFDGLYSGRTREKILEIMRDSRIGTYGVLAIVSVVLLNYTLLAEVNKSGIYAVLMLFPVAGRTGSLVGAGSTVYARSGEGLGKSFIDFCGWKEVLVGIIITASTLFLIFGTIGAFIPFAFAITAYMLSKIFSSKIGGATGDILGAVCEISQIVFLVGYVALQHFKLV